jgi:UDP-2-acetamido-3-amino-2,3-dideoxy-glucuronate N-acetyltransferase
VNNKINVAVVGAGVWGINLVRNFYTLGTLKLVCDKHNEQLKKIHELYPDLEFENDFNHLIKRSDIHAVVIATPASTHANLAIQALEAGKDVLVEKPMALSVYDGEKMVETAYKHNRILMVGHVLEYHSGILKLKQLLNSGEIGKIQYIYSNRLNIGRFRMEENALWSFAPHDISVLLRLLGDMPDEVACHGGAYLNHEIADVTISNFKFPNGVRAHIFVSWLHPFKEQKLVVIGNKQMLVFDDTLQWDEKLKLYPHIVDWINGRIPVAHKAEAENILIKEIEPLKEEAQRFLYSISTREQPITDGESGLSVLKVLAKCQQSLERGGTTIKSYEGIKVTYFAHETATIDAGCEIGEGTKVWHYTHVMPLAKIGKDCVLGQNVFIGRSAKIGDECKIQNNVSIYEGVTLEDKIFCGPSVVFTNVINPRSEINRKDEFRPTLVKQGATLGANCTIVCGHTIGRYAFVGAGSVITKDVPDYALVYGNSAKIVGWVCECGERLQFENSNSDNTEFANCDKCGKQYQKKKLVVEHMELLNVV